MEQKLRQPNILNIDKISNPKNEKKISIIICAIALMFVFMCLEYYFRSFTIADGVKIKRMLNGDYYISYKGERIGGIVTAFDSWYIYQRYVHGSTTAENTTDNIVYFIIDTCNGEIYQTKSHNKLYSYLKAKHIPYEGNYMSGDNVIDMKTWKNKYHYDGKSKCPH